MDAVHRTSRGWPLQARGFGSKTCRTKLVSGWLLLSDYVVVTQKCYVCTWIISPGCFLSLSCGSQSNTKRTLDSLHSLRSRVLQSLTSPSLTVASAHYLARIGFVWLSKAISEIELLNECKRFVVCRSSGARRSLWSRRPLHIWTR